MAPFGSDAITDVAGLRVGHFTDPRRPTGCSVILCDGPGAVAGVDVRGAAPGTRETELLAPQNLVERIHALVLAGGSAFGLDAASGVMRWLEARGVGLAVGPARVPIVPAAILFDLAVGDHRIRPDANAGWAACEAASADPPSQGSVGAGAGASVGKLFGMDRAMRGGIGTASIRVGGLTVGAMIAVNAVGDVVDPGNGRVIAGLRSPDGRAIASTRRALLEAGDTIELAPGAATTIGCVATDARLSKAQAMKLAQMAHDGLARSIDPVHTMLDGDTVFALATGHAGEAGDMTVLGEMAADSVARAVVRAVLAAGALDEPGLPVLPAASEFGRRPASGGRNGL
ncbi:MAG: P1 family peptidase [Burkholderiaceae bacterium]|nr:P1 family peptidase [Burkholderiaceae bacterium]